MPCWRVQDVFLDTHGVKLGFMSAFVKAAADALHKVPAVNAVIDGSEIVYRDYSDISIAVATPKGLVVPVLRNVDMLTFAEVEKVSSSIGFFPEPWWNVALPIALCWPVDIAVVEHARLCGRKFG